MSIIPGCRAHTKGTHPHSRRGVRRSSACPPRDLKAGNHHNFEEDHGSASRVKQILLLRSLPILSELRVAKMSALAGYFPHVFV